MIISFRCGDRDHRGLMASGETGQNSPCTPQGRAERKDGAYRCMGWEGLSGKPKEGSYGRGSWRQGQTLISKHPNYGQTSPDLHGPRGRKVGETAGHARSQSEGLGLDGLGAASPRQNNNPVSPKGLALF